MGHSTLNQPACASGDSEAIETGGRVGWVAPGRYSSVNADTLKPSRRARQLGGVRGRHYAAREYVSALIERMYVCDSEVGRVGMWDV